MCRVGKLLTLIIIILDCGLVGENQVRMPTSKSIVGIRINIIHTKKEIIEDTKINGINKKVHYENQNNLYRFILEKAIPHMLEEKDAEALGLSVVRAWAKFGLFPFRFGRRMG